ncbi:MAG: hypothetical protein G01um101418_70 [Parcubacteria group bacterium Gr01-1014_18]|nr:MAG: hypothetical protein Greene041636_70 [Parcubacteria group bacterium Greene0416_36]TSC81576.1 MAG: hypothetical protein G01um101418_70 [Parcubacteria group bacterium Gr01-1014_18]TSC99613.1 MAG: hypothetical protein Greene101420_17 [Parcubacteria group bacterium Greene1014_20]TSD07064.1 MAG: hypothetical protein Greene07142_376 [Parcubacteria group bacterium Greene0714_2]
MHRNNIDVWVGVVYLGLVVVKSGKKWNHFHACRDITPDGC